MVIENKVRIETDAETYRVLSAIAQAAGQSPETLLKVLADQYKQANTFERQIVIRFLKGRLA